MNAKLVLRVEWNETVRTCCDPFDTKKFSNLSPEILVEWIAPSFLPITVIRHWGERVLLHSSLVFVSPVSTTADVQYSSEFFIISFFVDGRWQRGLCFSIIVQFRIRHDRWIKALTTHFYRVSLDLKKIFINTSGKVTQIWILNNTQSCKQVIFSLEFVNILL